MRWLGKKLSGFSGSQGGFSLMEVLVAVGILGFIGTGVVLGLDTNHRASRVLDEKVVATNLVTAHLEAIKEVPFAVAYPDVGSDIDIPMQYEVTIETECSLDGETFTTCTASENQTFQKIVVSVTREGRPVLSVCSYRTKR